MLYSRYQSLYTKRFPMTEDNKTTENVLEVVWPWRNQEELPKGPQRPGPGRLLLQALIPAAVGGIFFAFDALGKPVPHVAVPLVPIILWSLSGILLFLGLFIPKAFFWVEHKVFSLVAGIGWLMSWILLAPLYAVFFCPAHFFRALRGKDALQRKLDPEADSYWNEREKISADNYYSRQF